MKLKTNLMAYGLALALTAANALGVPTYLSYVPNTATFSCSTCHTVAPTRNAFGLAFANNGHVWNATLAHLDSDGDGFSNGTELGDPNGTWTMGSPDPSGPVFNPGDPASHPTVTATAPSITTQPASQTVTAGANVTFSVVATGTAPLSYQWMKNSANIAGATTSTLTLNNVASTDAGGYSVNVSNSAGSITSATATLTVNPVVVAPSITTQPVSQTVTAGANVSFNVVATGTAPLSYQWMKNSANIAGATFSNLTLNNVATTDAGGYSVKVSNSAGSATSTTATLTVNPAATAPSITLQPVSQTVTAGANVSFSVGASGTAPLSYQWMKNSANIAGATTATLTLSSVTAADAGGYSVKVSNSAGSVTSSTATLAVNPVALSVAISSPTNGQVFVAPADVPVSATVTPSTGIANVQFFDDTNLLGTVTAAPYTLTISNISLGDHVLTAQVTDTQAGTALSLPVAISVISAPPPPSTQPVVTIVAPRNGATYRALANIALVAQVSDPGASVTQVQFYSGTTLIGTATPLRMDPAGEPNGEVDDDASTSAGAVVYVFQWARVPAGQYSITAKATDSLGAVGVSASDTIIVRRGTTGSQPERSGERE